MMVADEVETTSGAGRLANTVLCAIFGFPVLIICGCYLIYVNEMNAVCMSSAFLQGEEMVQPWHCDNPHAQNGSLLFLHCDLEKEGLQPLRLPGSTDFSGLSHAGVGLKVVAEMLQCVEHATEKTLKDSVGGGTTTHKTYSYSLEWRARHVASGDFSTSATARQKKAAACGPEANPQWPPNVPRPTTVWSETIRIGGFRSSDAALIEQANLTRLVAGFQAPSGWRKESSGHYTSMNWAVPALNGQSPSGLRPGAVRVSFLSNDWSKPKLTVLAGSRGGQLVQWMSPSTWLCASQPLSRLEAGTLTRKALFRRLHDEVDLQTWILRFVGFCILWAAVMLLFGPLQVALDCIPCAGRHVSDQLEAVTCCISCLPATACTSLIIGVVWVVTRPLIGISLLATFGVVFCGFTTFKAYGPQRPAKEKLDYDTLS